MGRFTPFYIKAVQGRKGQIAPLMIMLIATVLVCMMVVFNIGKVSLNKVHTQNAADAGALAASSWLASGQNMVADVGMSMNYASLGFIAMMADIVWSSIPHALAVIGNFIEQQVMTEDQASIVAHLAHERADDAVKLYAFINSGVDEQKEPPLPIEPYIVWKKKPTPFETFLQGAYKVSPVYVWSRWTEYESWDAEKKDFVKFRKYRPCEVAVLPGGIGRISYSWGMYPGLTWAFVWHIPPIIVPVPFVVIPAYLQTHGNPGASVTVNRSESGTDWGLWQMHSFTATSSASAKTIGGGSIWTGGRYDSQLR